MRKLKSYIASKSIKQRIYLIILSALFVFVVFSIIKVNLHRIYEQPQTSQAQNADNVSTSETAETVSEIPPPEFHISLIDISILLAIISAYIIHKYREKKRERRQ